MYICDIEDLNSFVQDVFASIKARDACFEIIKAKVQHARCCECCFVVKPFLVFLPRCHVSFAGPVLQ